MMDNYYNIYFAGGVHVVSLRNSRLASLRSALRFRKKMLSCNGLRRISSEFLFFKCAVNDAVRNYTSHPFFLIMAHPSVTGEVYCFPRRQLIFSFGRRVIYHLKGLSEYIPSVCLYHDLQTNSGTWFLS